MSLSTSELIPHAKPRDSRVQGLRESGERWDGFPGIVRRNTGRGADADDRVGILDVVHLEQAGHSVSLPESLEFPLQMQSGLINAWQIIRTGRLHGDRGT